MRLVYDNLLLKPGATNHGIVSIKVAPREWLSLNPIIDFNTGQVVTAITLIAGKAWIVLEFTQPSYEYTEKPKSNKSGSFYEVSLSGTLNYIDAAVQQVIETIRYHELAAIVMNRNKQFKLVGNKDAGLVISPSNKIQNTSGGQQVFQLDMLMESEQLPPFYSI